MIITRSPLRISLGGGGTDLPSYYREHEGFLIAGAIDKYVYVSHSVPFEKKIILKYSQNETVDEINKIDHKIFREILRYCKVELGVEITSTADIPAGTGLGSSGSFTIAVLQAVFASKREYITPEKLAQLACYIEIDLLGEPIGKQDQYIAAYGGLSCFEFHKDDTVTTYPLDISEENLFTLEENLMLFFTGFSRSASKILKDQDEKSKSNNQEMIENLHFTKELGLKSKESLIKGKLTHFAELMHIHWEHKRKRSLGMSNSHIDDWYSAAIKAGAIGGKVVGAGGGGFLLLYAENKTPVRNVMKSCGLQEVRFKFDFLGSRILSV